MIKVNFEETIRRKQLVGDNSHVFETACSYCLVFILVSATRLMLPDVELSAHRLAYNYLLFPLATAVVAYCLYEKTVENRLFTIRSSFNAETNSEIIINFFKKEKWYIEHSDEHNFIATVDTTGLGAEKQATVIITDNQILLNVIRSSSGKGAALPLLYLDILTRNAIIKAIDQYGLPINH